MRTAELTGLPEGVAERLADEGIEELYPPQADAVDAGATDGESVVASVPTASGKTLIAELAMLSSVARGGKALYIVPLRALASEKKSEFERWEEFGVDVGVSTGNYESSGEWLASRDIIVATSEKVDSLVRNDAPWMDDLTCVVADEVHLVDDGHRGPTLEVTLAKLRKLNPGLQVVALSATVGNADEVAEWLDARLVESDWRPIDLKTGVHYGNAISFEDGSQREVPVGRGERQTPALVDDILSDEVESQLPDLTEDVLSEISSVARRELSELRAFQEDDEHRAVEELVADSLRHQVEVSQWAGDGDGWLISANSVEDAEAMSESLAEQRYQALSGSEERRYEEMSVEARQDGSTVADAKLARCLESGIAFLHEGLSESNRRWIEEWFSQGLIEYVCLPPRESARTNLKSGKTLTRGGSSLVFVNSRRNAEAAARRLADVTEAHLSGEERDALADIAAEIREVSDTETSDDLAAAVERGAAFHHAGLASEHRNLVEDAFRDRTIKAISATPTLAAGVNTPSRRVIVRDWQRYDGEFGGMKPLDVLEVHQMMGRAGRPGLDPYGEAVLLASDADTREELFERYVWADPEPVRSKLAAQNALRTHVLATVASGFARTRDGLLDFLDGTLYAAQTDEQGRLESVTDSVLDYLVANGFVEREGGELSATGLGHTVSRLYLDPMSAAEIVDGLRSADATGDGDERLTPLGLYHLVSRTPDMYQLYLKSGDRETYTELCYEREAEFLGSVPSEFEDVRFEEWLSALKTATLLEDWASEVDEDRLTERYGVGPGDIRGKVDTAEWLLGAAESLAGELDLGTSVAVREAKKRVEYGVREELLDLAGVRGVGRKRARRLFEAGIETRADLREADKSVVLRALRGRRRTAETILENAGRRDPSMDGVSEAEGAAGENKGDDAPADAAEFETAARDRDGGEGDAEEQASLGDFG